VHQLDLQRREEALGHGIVPTIAAPAHAADDPFGGVSFAKTSSDSL
jgi:hypothetical protein